MSEEKRRPSASAVAQIETLANEMFGFQEAFAWLKRPNPMLGWQTPREALACRDGDRRVQEVLMAIKHGDTA